PSGTVRKNATTRATNATALTAAAATPHQAARRRLEPSSTFAPAPTIAGTTTRRTNPPPRPRRPRLALSPQRRSHSPRAGAPTSDHARPILRARGGVTTLAVSA